MIRTTLTISGMRCGMCEAHVNDVIRASFPVKKVASSHREGKTTILSEKPLDIEKLRQAVNATGYIVLSAREDPEEKKSFFPAFLKRKS